MYKDQEIPELSVTQIKRILKNNQFGSGKYICLQGLISLINHSDEPNAI
jgi:hypothetical protein